MTKLLPRPLASTYLMLLGVFVLGVFLVWQTIKGDDFSFFKLRLGYTPEASETFDGAAVVAVQGFDYSLAQKLLITRLRLDDDNVLGISSEVVETIYPERKLWRRLEEMETVLKQQPTFRDGLLLKTIYLSRMGRNDEAEKVFEEVFKLDPNHPEVIRVGITLGLIN